MRTIHLEVKDDYFENTLAILNSLKNIMIDKISTSYTSLENENEIKYFQNISTKSLNQVWDNKEDAVYDKFVQ